MNLKTLNYIRNKAQLQDLYLNQIPERVLEKEINDILKETRTGIPIGMRHHAKALLTHEVIIFMDRNGTPDGYLLSEELEIKLNMYRDRLTRNKLLQQEFERINKTE